MKQQKARSKKPMSEKNLSGSDDSYLTDPETVFEQINKYGTYEIQPTAATEHSFPKIAQGLPKQKHRKHEPN